MDEQRQDDQLEPIYNRAVLIQDIVLKTSQERWTIETVREGQGDPCWQHDIRMLMMMIDLLRFEQQMITLFVGEA